MWHLFRYKAHPADVEGIEQAKKALEVAKQIERHAYIAEAEHRDILRRNHLGPKIHKALGGK